MSKSNSSRDRRERVEELRRQAQADERRRTLVVVAVCAVIALIITGIAVYAVVSKNRANDELAARDLTDIGGSAKVADCTSVQDEEATGASEHVTGPVDYELNPPAYGPHFDVTADPGLHFYRTDDRPEVERLVHNLEHGWTIVWYDEEVAGDDEQLAALEAAGAKFDAEGQDPQFNVIFAPWTSDDGEPIPEGKHIAYTHWSVHMPEFDPAVFEGPEPPPSFGESQYCDTFSGDALDEFMTAYPYDDAPEGYLWPHE
ncbi:MAG: DUF3105 domain-containing protein [Nocardioidaceae bacterium]